MRASSVAKRLVAVCGIAVATSIVGMSMPAQAATGFLTCVDSCAGGTRGSITWFNRTANVSGSVFDSGYGTTTAIFEAFAGSTKIDVETRFADDQGSTGPNRSFSFTIGDTDLVGGIDRIRITVCKNYQTIAEYCSPQDNYWRS